MAAPPTIPFVKQAFLSAQTTILSQPLAPSRTWRTANDASEEPVPERLLEDALFNLNHSLQQHCRRVYAPQANRNVAEQISDAYSRDASRRIDGDAASRHGGLAREIDLTETDVVEALPPAWESERDTTSSPMEAKRYSEMVGQLRALSEQRNELKVRVQRLRSINATIGPLRATDDSGAGIQENLVTRDGAVEKELERMRFLLARVSGRVGQLPEPAADADADAEAGQPSRGGADIDFGLLGGSRKRTVDEFLADPRVFPVIREKEA